MTPERYGDHCPVCLEPGALWACTPKCDRADRRPKKRDDREGESGEPEPDPEPEKWEEAA